MIPEWLKGAVGLAALAVILPSDGAAYPRYRQTASSGYCVTCHGRFFDATSPKGTLFPLDSKHEMHRNANHMDTTCALCHTTGDERNPFIASSDGTPLNPGHGCAGCHGREGDANQVPGEISPGRGAGLRQHHWNSGVAICNTCHEDAHPAVYTPVGENFSPTYYGTAPDTLADEACNALVLWKTNENWSIDDFGGLDNDGDGAYDGGDVDCRVILIDGFESGGTGGWSITVP